MDSLPKTWLMVFAVALVGCNNGLSGLDRGTVRVNGLGKPQTLAPAIVKNATQGDALNAGEKQTRQTVAFLIAEDVLAQGSDFSLRRRLPEPAQDLATATKIPTSGNSATAGEFKLERLPEGGGKLSFYAGTLLRTSALSYGDNVLQLAILNDNAVVYQMDLQVKFRDFDLAAPALIGAVKSATPQEGTMQQAWLSLVKQSEVTDAQGDSDPQTIMRSGFFSIINP